MSKVGNHIDLPLVDLSRFQLTVVEFSLLLGGEPPVCQACGIVWEESSSRYQT